MISNEFSEQGIRFMEYQQSSRTQDLPDCLQEFPQVRNRVEDGPSYHCIKLLMGKELRQIFWKSTCEERDLHQTSLLRSRLCMLEERGILVHSTDRAVYPNELGKHERD